MKQGLDPIENESSETLILGSLPGDISIKLQQYYAHPRNHFWHIVAALLTEPLYEDYSERCAMLLRHKVALWDVLHAAEREGSLDSSIKNGQPNDLERFLREHPRIRQIILNGSTAGKCFEKHFPNLDIPHVVVRSSSPIPAKECNTLEEKTALWRKAWIL